MLDEVIRNVPQRNPDDGRITFAGAVNTYTKFFLYDDVRKELEIAVPKSYIEVFKRRWDKEKTYEPNCSIYRKIYEKLKDQNKEEMPLADYDDDLVLGILNSFQFKEGKKVLEDNTIGGYRAIFWRLYKTASVNEPFPDCLRWDEKGLIKETRGRSELDIRKNKMFLLKRSFSFEDEKRLADWFKSNLENPEESDGRIYGLLLMFCLGLRNSEAAGLDFSCFREIPDKGFHCIYVLKTMNEKTQETKIGGKTYNVFRKIPVPPFLEAILQRRFEVVVQHIIKHHHVSEIRAREKASTYMIACDGVQFSKNIDRDDLTIKGRELLELLRITNIQKEVFLQEDFSQRLKENEIDERDPTTYIFRRNAATHYYNLGLSDSQLQFLMGHMIEDDQERRSFFVNDDRTEEIYRIMLNHPLALLFGGAVSGEKEICIPEIKKSKTVFISIAAKEPNEGITIETLRPDRIDYLPSNAFRPEGYSDTVDITASVNKAYMTMMLNDDNVNDENLPDEFEDEVPD